MNQPGDRERLLRDSFISLGALGGSKVMMFGTGVLVARLLGPEDLGLFTLLLAIATAVSSFSAFGVPQAATKYLSEKDVRASGIPSNALFTLSISTLLASLLLILGGTWLAGRVYDTPALSVFFPILAAFVVASNLQQLFMALLQGLGAIKWYNIVTMSMSLLYLLTVGGGTWIAGLHGALWGSVAHLVVTASAILVAILKGPATMRVSLSPKGISAPVFNRIVHFGMLLSLGGAFAYFAQWLAPTVLVKHHGYGTLGFFRVANLLSSNLMIIPMAIAIPLFPSISFAHATDKARFSILAKDSFRLVVMTTLPLSLLLCFFSEELLVAFFGSEYAPAWQLLFLMSAAGFMMAINSNAGSLYFGSGEMTNSLMLNGVWGLVFALAAWLLIPPYGAAGFALAYVVSYVVLTLIQLSYQRMKWGVRFNHLIPLAIGIPALFVFGYALKLFLHGWLFHTVALAIVVFLLAVEFRLLSQGEKSYLIRKLHLHSLMKAPTA